MFGRIVFASTRCILLLMTHQSLKLNRLIQYHLHHLIVAALHVVDYVYLRYIRQ